MKHSNPTRHVKSSQFFKAATIKDLPKFQERLFMEITSDGLKRLIKKAYPDSFIPQRSTSFVYDPTCLTLLTENPNPVSVMEPVQSRKIPYGEVNAVLQANLLRQCAALGLDMEISGSAGCHMKSIFATFRRNVTLEPAGAWQKM